MPAKTPIDETIRSLRSLFGPLKPARQRALRSYVKKPTERGWRSLYCTIINPNGLTTTVWQYVLRVNPRFPKRGPVDGERWAEIPDQITILRALRMAQADLAEAETSATGG